MRIRWTRALERGLAWWQFLPAAGALAVALWLAVNGVIALAVAVALVGTALVAVAWSRQ